MICTDPRHERKHNVIPMASDVCLLGRLLILGLALPLWAAATLAIKVLASALVLEPAATTGGATMRVRRAAITLIAAATLLSRWA